MRKHYESLDNEQKSKKIQFNKKLKDKRKRFVLNSKQKKRV